MGGSECKYDLCVFNGTMIRFYYGTRVLKPIYEIYKVFFTVRLLFEKAGISIGTRSW